MTSATLMSLNNLEMEQVLDEICMANGINPNVVRQSKHEETVRSIEMFFNGFPTIVHMERFPNLKELKVIAQELYSISGLDTCVNLEELWVAECKLTKISNLKYCRNLRRLYLYSNKIYRIENIEHLTNLDVLWLANNKLTKIENLNTLFNLKELNLAKNQITTIGDSLNNLENLEDLNLSANLIDRFDEITFIQNLPSLKNLCLKDPQYGSNPVTILCNYSLYIIYHLPNLATLDTLAVSQKIVKELADSTINKKKLWYFMRIATTKREMNEIIHKLDRIKETESKPCKDEIDLYISKIKDIIKKQNMKKIQSSSGGESSNGDKKPPSEEDKLLIKQYEDKIAENQTKLKIIESQYKISLSQLTQEIEIKKNYNFIELENGGNIKFEYGTPSDIWYKSCSDLLMSRFCSADYLMKSISGIKVRQVIRLTNRLLISRYEESLINEIDENEYMSNKPSLRKRVDYLMYCWRPKLGTQLQELYEILKHGFKDPNIYRKCGFEEAIPFSNSLSVCDHLRIESLKHGNSTASKYNANVTYKYGYALLCKVYTSKFVPYSKQSINPESYPDAFGVRRPFRTEINKLLMSQQAAPQTSGCDCKSKQAEWFLFNKNLAVPEYIIEYEYLNKINFENYFDIEQYDIKQKQMLLLKQSAEQQQQVINISSVKGDESMDKSINDGAVKENNFLPNDELINKEIEIQLSALENSNLDNLIELNLHNSNLTSLECDTFKMLKCLKKLIISFNNLKSIKEVCQISNLEYLDASHNQIDSILDLKGPTKINYLDLSYNSLSDIVSTNFSLRQFFPMLMQLNLNENKFKRVEKMKALLIYTLRSLIELNLEKIDENVRELYNYAYNNRSYKDLMKKNSYFLAQRPRCLRYYFLTDLFYVENKMKLININTPNKNLIRNDLPLTLNSNSDGIIETEANANHTSSESRSNSSVSASTSDVASTSRGSSVSSAASTQLSIAREKPMTGSTTFFNKVTTLILDNQKLFKLAPMDALINLKWASFNNNYLIKIEGLGKCTKLEELSFDNNLIRSISGIEGLANLRKLTLNFNEIDSYDSADSSSDDWNANSSNIKNSSNEENFINTFTNLTKLNYLSITNNKLSSIKFLKKLTGIVEFYASFNELKSLRDLFQLKMINTLSILDISNNPFCFDLKYRLFVIYHLKSLRSLDGSLIETNEINEARDLFGGKLTCDFIAEKLGHSRFDEIKFLDFPQCSFKTVDLVNSVTVNLTGSPSSSLGQIERFENLRSLNLENNFLTSFSGIVHLYNLKILCLNNNKIETILPKSKQQQQQNPQNNNNNTKLEQILPNLEVLHLAYNGISDLVNLQISRLTSLKALFLQGNEISKLEGLESLKDLRELVLDKNKIKFICENSLSGQTQRLLELHIEENRLRDLSNLNSLKNLQKLYVANNKISEFSDFERLIDLNHLQELSLMNNPVARRPHYRISVVYRLRRLRTLDMSEITDEDRIKAEIYFNEQQQLMQQSPQTYYNGAVIQTAPMIGPFFAGPGNPASSGPSQIAPTPYSQPQGISNNQINFGSQFESQQLLTVNNLHHNLYQSPRLKPINLGEKQTPNGNNQFSSGSFYAGLAGNSANGGSGSGNQVANANKLLKMKNQYDKLAKDIQARHNKNPF